MFARGEILAHDEVTLESGVTAETFHGRVIERSRTGARSAVITEITGRAFVTGFHEFIFDPEDPFSAGFLVGTAESAGR